MGTNKLVIIVVAGVIGLIVLGFIFSSSFTSMSPQVIFLSSIVLVLLLALGTSLKITSMINGPKPRNIHEHVSTSMENLMKMNVSVPFVPGENGAPLKMPESKVMMKIGDVVCYDYKDEQNNAPKTVFYHVPSQTVVGQIDGSLDANPVIAIGHMEKLSRTICGLSNELNKAAPKMIDNIIKQQNNQNDGGKIDGSIRQSETTTDNQTAGN